LGKWGVSVTTSNVEHEHENPIDRAIIVLFSQVNKPISPKEVADKLGWHRVTIRKHILLLAQKKAILPFKEGRKRNKLYVRNPDNSSKNQG
jgi:predicted ArsR family transcriptional regulator